MHDALSRNILFIFLFFILSLCMYNSVYIYIVINSQVTHEICTCNISTGT